MILNRTTIGFWVPSCWENRKCRDIIIIKFEKNTEMDLTDDTFSRFMKGTHRTDMSLGLLGWTLQANDTWWCRPCRHPFPLCQAATTRLTDRRRTTGKGAGPVGSVGFQAGQSLCSFMANHQKISKREISWWFHPCLGISLAFWILLLPPVVTKPDPKKAGWRVCRPTFQVLRHTTRSCWKAAPRSPSGTELQSQAGIGESNVSKAIGSPITYHDLSFLWLCINHQSIWIHMGLWHSTNIRRLQELNILFDRKNGLAPGKYYQARAAPSAPSAPSPLRSSPRTGCFPHWG